MQNDFTIKIASILEGEFNNDAKDIWEKSPLIQYLNIKTKSANKGSKSRSSFANLYAIYVMIEDYVNGGYVESGLYYDYIGAQFSNLLSRQRELPFGTKLQNHALNSRFNEEFKKYFQTVDVVPIIRDLENKKYWFNENLLIIDLPHGKFNIARTVLKIIDEYILVKQNSLNKFINTCLELQKVETDNSKAFDFINSVLEPNVDARLFEIVSFSILKYFYKDQYIIWGYNIDNLNKDNLTLYKTGRTNANDGGIDFVMKPLGRFFQVTETLDFKKYFLDIEKIEKYPISFVVKTEDSELELRSKIYNSALKSYVIESVVEKYMLCIEDIINIPQLRGHFHSCCKCGYLNEILNEIILQSKVEFNYEDDEIDY